MKLLSTIALLAFAATLAESRAQSFFTSPAARYLEPSWRGAAEAEFSWWDVLYSPWQGTDYPDGVNYPDMAAPNGTGRFASEAHFTPPANSLPTDPYAFFDPANPTLAQTGTNGAFIIGPGTAGNVYSFSGATGFVLSDQTPYTLGTVNLQWQTDGSPIDFATLRLNYVSGGSTLSLAPTNLVAEYQASGSSFGFSLRNRLSAQWNLTDLGITSYTISFQSRSSSNSFQEALLDTSATYAEATPSTRAWSGQGGNTKWSTLSNWTGGALPSARGNVIFSTGTGVQVDSAREISLLSLATPGAFVISGARLQLNTGITATSGAAIISAPLTFGAFNLLSIGATTEVTLAGALDGVAGFQKTGGGILRLTGTNTFSGQVAIDGGTTYISGANSYNGATTVLSGQLILQGHAPSGAAGTLGNASSAISVGSGGTFGEPEAALLIDGPFTVGRNLMLGNGADGKKLGARNTATGATFSGNVLLNSAATSISLEAAGAADRVTFSGTISGGRADLSVTKTGAGTVVFAGSDKSYQNSTTISAGTLRIDSGSFTGDGKMTVANGAQLLVHGTLGGAGALALDGGTLGGAGQVTRPFMLDTGDVLSPGNGIGTLTTAAETWAGEGRLRLEIKSTSAGWDSVVLNDTLTIAADSSTRFILELDSLTATGAPGLLAGFDRNRDYHWTFASAAGGIVGFDPSAFTVDTAAFANPLNGVFQVSRAGNELVLDYLAVPEPSSAWLLLLGLAGLLRRRFSHDHTR